jgi:pyruvate kinase
VVRHTKIIATLGPASSDPSVISEMVAAGMDVARLNFSHGTYESHAALIEAVRRAADEHDRAVAILQDIQGPRIRVGTFPDGVVEVEAGTEVRLHLGHDEGTATEIFVQHLDRVALEPGSIVVMSDGLIRLEITEVGDGLVRATVVEGGTLSDHKGVAFPGVRLDLPAITDKDVDDLAFGLEHGVDVIAASFVTSGDDIRRVKSIVGDDMPVIAKIERVEAYENLDDILSVADGAMVARGDLGVELGIAPLPRAQKDILARTNAVAAISITATEMLESMTSSPRPTRAEVTDVANAVLDGTDAVMLSAETAAGKYPARAVKVMASICLEAEASPGYPENTVMFADLEPDFASAIAHAAADAAAILDLKLVVAFTESGSTARLAAKYRPEAPIVAFSPHQPTYNRLALEWGVTPLRFPTLSSTDKMIAEAARQLLERGMVADGDWVAMIAGIPPNQRASTNLLKLHVVGADAAGIPGAAEETDAAS